MQPHRKTPMLPERKPPDARLIGAALAAILVLVAVAFMLFAEQPRPLVRTVPTAAPVATLQAQPTATAQPTPEPQVAPTPVWPTITPLTEPAAPVQAAPAVAQPAVADELPVIVAVPAAPAEAHEPLRIRAEDDCNAEHGRCTPPCTAEHGRCEAGEP